ncbi:AAA family ATPase [Caldalkalibacillus mannanilyticus]|uniref:AAA family ATPase n=1 Tax=Caldalkalibacillus mannanilyticus TaxID=1418 RepID=UPI0034E2D83E
MRAEQLLERFKLREEKHHLPPSFSKGMQQKLMIILAFLIQPDLYIVDEPFVGLDPTATKVFLELLSQERQRGAGILMSTHVLDTAEKICERFVLLNGGRIIAQGNLAEIQKQCGLESSSLLECFNHLVEILK